MCYSPNPKIKFEVACKEASEKTGVEVCFFGNDGKAKTSFYEDDGNLHLFKGKGWACFDVGQGQRLSGKEQNIRTRAVMTVLGLENYINDRVLVDETEDDDEDECPCCGRSHY